VIDVRVRDDDVADVVERDALAEARPYLVEALRRPLMESSVPEPTSTSVNVPSSTMR